MSRLWKKILSFGVILTTAALLCTFFTTTVNAAADIYIAGNPNMEPFEYYDEDEKCYKGILPAFYSQLESEMGVSFEYLPPYGKDFQIQHAKNRQVELVSAHYRWDTQDLWKEITIYTYHDGQKTYDISVGFTRNLPKDQAEQIEKALQNLSADNMLQLQLSKNTVYDSSHYAGIIFASLSAVALVIVLWYFYRRRKRVSAVLPTKHVGDWNDYEAAYRALSPSEIQRLCYVGLLTSDLRSLSHKDIQVLLDRTGLTLLKYTGKREAVFKISNDIFGVILLCDNANLALHRMTDLITVLNQVSVPGHPSPTRFRGGLYAPQDATVSSELAFERARLGWMSAEKKGLPIFLLDQKNLMLEEKNQYLRSVLPRALERKEFRLYLQFIADSKTGAFCGAEAVSRWDEPRGGLLHADSYLPLLYEAQVLDQLDMGLFEQSCRLLEQWQNTELKDLWITQNFSHQTISQKHFPNWFLGISNRYHFPHNQFILEISEGLPSSYDAIIRRNLAFCKSHGFRIAMDDLGHGETTLRDIGAEEIDFVKLDRQFFLEMQTHRERVVLTDIIQSAHNLNLKVVCETEDELQKAVDVGCDYIQSFAYSQIIPYRLSSEYVQKHKASLMEEKQTANTI